MLCAAVAAVSAAPRYLVIPIEDVDMSMFSGQTLPVYRVPGLARTARMAQEEDSYQSAPAPYDSQGSSSDASPGPPAWRRRRTATSPHPPPTTARAALVTPRQDRPHGAGGGQLPVRTRPLRQPGQL